MLEQTVLSMGRGNREGRSWTAMYHGHSATVRKQIERSQGLKIGHELELIGEIRWCCPGVPARVEQCHG